jgi:hypothetical protein
MMVGNVVKAQKTFLSQNKRLLLYDIKLPESYIRDKEIVEIHASAKLFINSKLWEQTDTLFIARFEEGKIRQQEIWNSYDSIRIHILLTTEYDSLDNIAKQKRTWLNPMPVDSDFHTYTNTYEAGKIVYSDRDNSLVILYMYDTNGTVFSKRIEPRLMAKSFFIGLFGKNLIYVDHFHWKKGESNCKEEYFTYDKDRIASSTEATCYLQEVPKKDNKERWYYKYSNKGLLTSVSKALWNTKIAFQYDSKGIIQKETRSFDTDISRFKMIVSYHVIRK